MADDRSFLAAICAEPDEDVHRLVYADWLEENGRPERAEFIRVQCELARLPENDRRRPKLESCELQLVTRFRKGWAGPLRAWVKEWELARGFVERVKLPAAAFLEHADDLFRLAPVREVHLLGVADHADDLAACKHLRRLTGLTVSDPSFPVGQSDVHRRRSYRARGRTPTDLGVQVLRTLLASPHLRQLRRLGLAHNCLGSDGARLLASSARLADLVALDVRDNDFLPEDVAVLAESPHLSQVRELRLGSCYNGNSYDAYEGSDTEGENLDEEGEPEGAEVLRLGQAVAPFLGRLHLLDLGSCGISGREVRRLVTAAPRPPLNSLFLERNTLWERGFQTLLESAWPAHLTRLDLSSCYMDPANISSLARCKKLAGLTYLGLRNNPIGKGGIKALAASPYLKNLRRLDLQGSTAREWDDDHRERGEPKDFLGDTGVRLLAGSSALKRLGTLDLRRNEVTKRGLKALLWSALLERLHWLDLRHNPLGDAGAALLVRRGPWPRLAWLDLRDTGLGTAARQALRARFGPAVRY